MGGLRPSVAARRLLPRHAFAQGTGLLIEIPQCGDNVRFRRRWDRMIINVTQAGIFELAEPILDNLADFIGVVHSSEPRHVQVLSRMLLRCFMWWGRFW